MMKINNKWLPYIDESKPYKVKKIDSTIVDINIILTPFRRLIKYNEQTYECYLTNNIDNNLYVMFFINEKEDNNFDFIEQVIPINFVEITECNIINLNSMWFEQNNTDNMYLVKYNENYSMICIPNINMFRGEISLNGELRKCYIYNILTDINKLCILLQVQKNEMVQIDLLALEIDVNFSLELPIEMINIICHNCTLKNNITSKICSCCSIQLETISTYKPPTKTWSCIDCSFANSIDTNNCIICNTHKDWIPNDDFEENDFDDETAECSVCGDNTKITESITCNGDIKHTVCDGCFENSMKNQIGADNIKNFKSNDLKLVCCMCNDKLSEKDTALHLSKDAFEEYIKARDKIVQAKAEVETEDRVRKMLQNMPTNNKNNNVVKQHVDHIIQNILTLKCGNCNQAFVDFVGCFALNCNSCKQNFCGWCLEVAPNSLACHNHVRECQYNIMQGELFNTVESFDIAQNENRCYYIQEYMSTIYQYSIKKQIFDMIETNLNELGIYENFNYFCPNNKKRRNRNKNRNKHYINV